MIPHHEKSFKAWFPLIPALSIRPLRVEHVFSRVWAILAKPRRGVPRQRVCFWSYIGIEISVLIFYTIFSDCGHSFARYRRVTSNWTSVCIGCQWSFASVGDCLFLVAPPYLEAMLLPRRTKLWGVITELLPSELWNVIWRAQKEYASDYTDFGNLHLLINTCERLLVDGGRQAVSLFSCVVSRVWQESEEPLRYLAAFMGLESSDEQLRKVWMKHRNQSPHGGFETYDLPAETINFMTTTMSRLLPEEMLTRYGVAQSSPWGFRWGVCACDLEVVVE